MYAIAFDLDTEQLKALYSTPSWQNAYTDIRNFLATEGFEPQQGSVYFGNKNVNSVTCILAVQKMAKKFDWFSSSVRDIQMLRIEENSDLMPVISL